MALIASVTALIVVGADLLATFLSVFWPGIIPPLPFLLLGDLLWGAFRLPTLVVAIELFVLAVAATQLTNLGGGPFAD